MDTKRSKTAKVAVNKISGLHVDILSCIVSLLTIKEAARTSILSRTWRNIWKTSVASFPSLHLDVLPPVNMYALHNEFGDCIDGSSCYCLYKPSKWPAIENHKFVGYVFQILHLDHSSVRDSFRFRFYLENDFARYDGQWIIMAMAQLNDFARNIGQWIDMAISERHFGLLHLVIKREMYHDGNQYYQYPSLLSTQKKEKESSANRFSLKRCSIRPTDSNAYHSLIDLRLKYIVIGKEDTGSILSNSPNLVKLCLYRCEGWHTLDISGSMLKLEQLIILFCSDIKKVKIDANNLNQFLYVGDNRVKLMPINVPQLSNLRIRSKGVGSYSALGYACGKMSNDFPHLQSLMISVLPIEEKKLPKQLSLFCNLKKLVLLVNASKGTLWSFILLIQASPYLQCFELNLKRLKMVEFIDVEEINQKELMDRPCDFSHPYLEEIILGGFEGSSRSTHEVDFATYLLNTATNLKQFTVFFHALVYNTETGEMSPHSVTRMQRLERQNKGAWKKLRKHRRPGVKFVFAY